MSSFSGILSKRFISFFKLLFVLHFNCLCTFLFFAWFVDSFSVCVHLELPLDTAFSNSPIAFHAAQRGKDNAIILYPGFEAPAMRVFYK